jgi:hypothetical protein
MSTVHRVTSQKQLKGGACKPSHCRGLSIHYHALFHRLGAGSDRITSSLDFYKAEAAASSRFTSLSEGTQVGYVNTIIESHPEHLLPFTGSHFIAIDC